MNDLLPLPRIKPGRYRHYKGGEYQVLDVVRHSESLEPLVLYRPLYGASNCWVRPFEMFLEPVSVNGTTQPRFSLLAEAGVVSEDELAATVSRMESKLGLSSDLTVNQLMQLYGRVAERFFHDLASSRKDILLAKASALMLVQAAAGIAEGTG